MLRALSADVPALAPRLAALERAEKANLARAATLMRDWAKESETAKDEGTSASGDERPHMPFRRLGKVRCTRPGWCRQPMRWTCDNACDLNGLGIFGRS